MTRILRLRADPNGTSGWTLAPVDLEQELRVPRARLIGPDLIRDRDSDRTAWMLHRPARRRWAEDGTLEHAAPVSFECRENGEDVLLRASAPCELDLLVLEAAESAQFLADAPEPLGVLPTGAPLGRPRDLSGFLIGGAVLTPPFPWGSRIPSEQMALSIYRIARRRGGPFWTGLCKHLAEWTQRRIELPGGPPSQHEHLRFVADAALLLLAEAERIGSAIYRRGALGAIAVLDACATPFGGGLWYRHDRLEADHDENNLVLNTHLQAMTVLLAAGRDPTPAQLGLDEALTRRPPLSAAVPSMGLFMGDLARSARGPLRRAGIRLASASLMGAGRAQSAHAFLRLPGGRLLRHSLAEAEPFHYFIVNLSDLSALVRNMPSPSGHRALGDGLRVARLSRHFAAQRRALDPVTQLVPSLLRNAGHVADAASEARRLRSLGRPATVGWPGYEDALWDRLAPGTP